MIRAQHLPSWTARNVGYGWFSVHHAARLPFPLTESTIRQAFPAELEQAYQRYVRDVSRAEMAISVELSRLLYSLCIARRPKTILDMGSGFSSVVFRWFARHQASAAVWSVDDNQQWLTKTQQVLTGLGLATDKTLRWPSLREGEPIHADIILYDFSGISERVDNMPLLSRFAHPGSIVVLDDVHKPPIRKAAMEWVNKRGLRFTNLKTVTSDPYGRYAWLVHGFSNTPSLATTAPRG